MSLNRILKRVKKRASKITSLMLASLPKTVLYLRDKMILLSSVCADFLRKKSRAPTTTIKIWQEDSSNTARLTTARLQNLQCRTSLRISARFLNTLLMLLA